MAEENSILGTPPAETPPVETPPAETPPVETPPAETPPELNDFVKTLPEAIQTHESLKDVTSLEDLAEKFTKAPVAPVIPEEYKVPETAPSNIQEVAKKLNYTQEQLDGSLQYMQQYLEVVQKAERDAFITGRDQLFESWGDQKDTNLLLAQRARQLMDPDGGIKEILDDTGWGDNPLLIKAFADLGTKLKEGGFIKTTPKATSNEGKSFAQVMYPDMPSSQDS